MAEIALGAGIDAIGADAGFGVVQIDLHDPPLAPQMLDQEGEPGLDALAGIAAAVPQEGRFRGLLADRRAAADPPARGIALHRILDRLEVEPVMRAELAVLGSDRGADHVAVDLADRHPVARSAAPGQQVADHGRSGWWRDETVEPDPQDRDQEESDDQPDDPPEDAPRPRARTAAFVSRDRALAPLRHGGRLAFAVRRVETGERAGLPRCASAVSSRVRGLQRGPLRCFFGDQLVAHFLAALAAIGQFGPARFRAEPAVADIVEGRCVGNGPGFRGALRVKFVLDGHGGSPIAKERADARGTRPSFSLAAAKAAD